MQWLCEKKILFRLQYSVQVVYCSSFGAKKYNKEKIDEDGMPELNSICSPGACSLMCEVEQFNLLQ